MERGGERELIEVERESGPGVREGVVWPWRRAVNHSQKNSPAVQQQHQPGILPSEPGNQPPKHGNPPA